MLPEATISACNSFTHIPLSRTRRIPGAYRVRSNQRAGWFLAMFPMAGAAYDRPRRVTRLAAVPSRRPRPTADQLDVVHRVVATSHFRGKHSVP